MIVVESGGVSTSYDSDFNGIKKLSKLYPMVMEIAMRARDINEALRGIVEYLSSHNMNAYLSKDGVLSKAKKLLDAIRNKKKDIIPGGLADNKTFDEFNKKDLLEGAKVESEHTQRPDIAAEIASDHLSEDKKYYKKLKRMEKSTIYGESLTKADDKPQEPTPREEASEKTRKDLTGEEYKFARKSKISNKGEDIAQSARHKRGEWKGLGDAEASGQADTLVNSKTLLKYNPPDIMPKTPSDSLSALYAHYALQKFPKSPEVKGFVHTSDDNEPIFTEYNKNGVIYGIHRNSAVPEGAEKIREYTMGDIKKRAREVYVNAYDNVKKKAEELVNSGASHEEIGKQLRAFVRENMIEKPRQGSHPANASVDARLTNPYIPYYNKALYLSQYRPKANSTQDALSKFTAALASKHPEELAAKSPEFVNKMHEYAKKVIEGHSLADAMEIDKPEGPKKFNAADMYVGHAERIGPDHGMKDSANHENFLLNRAKLRGIQYGNSVSDSEREHHLLHTSNAMKDLTDILGLPEEMGSFNGRLGFAVGARGKGTALAHYEPDLKTINLTRKNGTGSLAHEWGHFMDNILPAVMDGRGGANSYSSEESRFDSKSHPIKSSMSKIMTYLNSTPRSRMIDWWRKEGREGISSNTLSKYWMSGREMFARAFEKYVNHKLEQNGRKNTYLSGVQDHPLWINKEEQEKVTPLFDELFNNFKNSEYLKKSMDFLKKDAAQIKHPILLPKNTRPEQNVRVFNPKSELQIKTTEKMLTPAYKERAKPITKDMAMTGGGVHDPYKTGQSFASTISPDQVVPHEAHHKTVTALVDKYGIEKVNKLYHKLVHMVPEGIRPLIHGTLSNTADYRALRNSSHLRHNLAYKEEFVNLVRDFSTGKNARREDLRNHYNKNNNYIHDLIGGETFEKVDNKLKGAWQQIVNHTKKLKPEDL